jgi:hypothetical protein
MDWRAYKKNLKAQSQLYQRRLRSLTASKSDRRILEAVIGTGDLPAGGWIRSSQQAYRRMASDSGQIEDDRAAGLGLISARVSFENVFQNRSIAISLILFASNADANLVLSNLAQRMSVRPFKARIVELTELSTSPVPELVDARVLEAVLSSESGRDQGRTVGRVVDTYLVTTSFSGEPSSWPWEQIVPIANLQAQRLQRWLAPSN